MSNRRASATMPIRRMRRPPPAKRLWYHWLSALLGWKRNHSQAISTIMARTRRLPALLMPFYEGSPRVKSPVAGFGFTGLASLSFLRAAFALVGPVHLRVRARCARHHLLSVPAYDAEHPMLYAPEAGKTNLIGTRRRIYQDGRAQRAAQENHGRLDQPSTLQAPVSECLARSDLGCDEPCALWHDPVLEVAPQRNQQFPRQRHDADAAHAQSPGGETRLIPLTECAPWLEAQPQPGNPHDHGSHPAITRLADALVALALSAVVGRTHQAGERGELTPVTKVPPAEELHHQEPGARRADRPQAHQMNDPALGFGSRVLQPLATFGLKRPDLALDERKALSLALKLGLQFQGQGPTIPQSKRLEPQPSAALDRHSHALGDEQRLHAHPMREPLALQALQLPVKAPGIFLFDAWYANHAPAAALARVVANELREQALAVEPVGLHVAKPAAHLDTGSVHNLVLDADASQVPVQPEAVAARLVAAHHPGRGRHPEALLGLRYRLGELHQVCRRHRHLAALGTVAEGQPPSLVAQLQRHVQHRRRCATFRSMGREVHLLVSFSSRLRKPPEVTFTALHRIYPSTRPTKSRRCVRLRRRLGNWTAPRQGIT